MPAYGNVILPTQVRTYMDEGHTTNRPPGNEYDQCLQLEKSMWDQVVSNGLDQLCCPQGRPPYVLKPYIAMPDSGRRFKEVSSLLVGTNFPVSGSVTFAVLSFKVPV